MPPPSLARQLFDRVVAAADPVAAIRGLINPADPLFESDWIDFKGEEPARPGRTPDPRQQEKSNRRAWSEYLSAFANTGGGVVLWGIDARKMEVEGRELDFAGAEALVTDPLVLASKLNEWQGQATDPPLSGVQTRPYPVPEDPTRGFVLCFVPEGPFKPYQSLLTENKQYYHRGGSSNFVMPKATLASLFYPRSKPVFRVRASTSRQFLDRGRDVVEVQAAVNVELVNDGTATAKDVTVWVRADEKGTPAGPTVRSNESWLVRDEGTRWEIRSRGLSIYPGQIVPLCVVEAKTTTHLAEAMPDATDTQFDLAVFCENQERQVFKLEFDAVEFGDEPHFYEFNPVE